MFPLGHPVFPGAPLGLRVFEPRYLEMMAGVLAGDRRMGVVLIERGSEVGGGDVRAGIGTVVEIVHVEDAGPRQLALVAVGRERIRVREWLPDDPYPHALVEPAPTSGSAPPASVDAAERAVRRALALAAEMGGQSVAADLRLPDGDPERIDALCALAPLGPFDKQRLLAADEAAARVELLAHLAAEAGDLLARRLGSG